MRVRNHALAAVCFAVVLLVTSPPAQAEEVLALVAAPEQIHLQPGERWITADYRVRNISSTPLKIRRARTCCDCVKVRFSTIPIPPGGEETVTLTFDTRGRVLPQLRTVLLDTDARGAESLLLTLAAFPPKSAE